MATASFKTVLVILALLSFITNTYTAMVRTRLRQEDYSICDDPAAQCENCNQPLDSKAVEMRRCCLPPPPGEDPSECDFCSCLDA